ncbi:MAG TPA: tetratricopeptide repeat protein, partial [Candidatus Bathyarchaeia archaeon]|nr:tetratricopeptide repeat protein [Candidatus Bathyarchaeia archaeon]
IPVTSRILYGEALQALREGDKEDAVKKLGLAADLTGDYAAPLFTLARVEFFSANPDFLPHFMEGLRRATMCYPAQAVLAANAAGVLILALFGATLATLIALLIKYRTFIDHKITEACGTRSVCPPARWIVGLICAALILMRLGLAIYVAILVIVLWVFMSRREKGAVVSLLVLLSAASFSSRYSNCLAPALDPQSVVSRLTLVNQRGVSENCIGRLRAITDDRFRAQRDFALGTMMYRFAVYDEAQKYLLESVSRRTDNAAAFINLGNVYFMQGDYDKALAGYQSAVELDSTNAIAHYNIGQTYIKKMLFAQSSDWLEHAAVLGIDAFRSAHPAIVLRNPPVYEAGFKSGELWSIAVAEGTSRPGNLMSEMVRPYLLFPFPWIWVLCLASLGTAMILARKLPEAWLVAQCDNCGKPTCAACADTHTGIRLCRECGEVIHGLSSVKVMEALLRTKRLKVSALRQKQRALKTRAFPGVSHTYHGRIFSGISLSLLGAAAIATLLWPGGYFKNPRSTSASEPVWSALTPLAALAVAYLLSFRVQKAEPQEQGKYHILPADLRMQEREQAKEKTDAETQAQSDPWKTYDALKESEGASGRGPSGIPEPKKEAAREEVFIGEIEKGSKWR